MFGPGSGLPAGRARPRAKTGHKAPPTAWATSWRPSSKWHRRCRNDKQRCEDVKLRSFLGQAAWAPQASHCPLPLPDFRLETLDLRLFRPPLHNLKWHQPRHLLQGQK